jgi:hypothetical protein
MFIKRGPSQTSAFKSDLRNHFVSPVRDCKITGAKCAMHRAWFRLIVTNNVCRARLQMMEQNYGVIYASCCQILNLEFVVPDMIQDVRGEHIVLENAERAQVSHFA